MTCRTFCTVGAVGFATVLLFASSTAFASNVTLTATDPINTSSFNTAGNWSNGLAPAAGNAYFVNGGSLRTPNASTVGNTFAGDSLTIGNGTPASATLAYKGNGGTTITVNNLSLNDGIVANAITGNFFLAGNGATLLAGGGIFDTDSAGRSVTVQESIGGVGALTANNAGGGGQGTITLLSSDLYSGGTIVNSSSLLQVEHDGGLGTGSVSVLSGGALTLTGGTTNSYIASGASLIVGSGVGSINLSYTGTDGIAALSLNNGATFLAAGTYGSTTSTAQNQSSIFTGSGILTVGGSAAAPEPSSATAILWGAPLLFGGGITVRRRREVRDIR